MDKTPLMNQDCSKLSAPSAPPYQWSQPGSSSNGAQLSAPHYYGPGGVATGVPVEQGPRALPYPILHPPHTQPANAYPVLPSQPAVPGAWQQPPDTHVMVCRHECNQPPSHIACGQCGRLVLPYSKKEAGACSWFVAAGMCVLGCWVCACLPFCLDSTKDTVFHCPQCHRELYRIAKP